MDASWRWSLFLLVVFVVPVLVFAIYGLAAARICYRTFRDRPAVIDQDDTPA